jgi:gamma-glutamyltranspeptidase
MKTPRAIGGMTTAPHHLASAAGAAVLRAGGNAAGAMIAMAATIAVVYPHMNAIGGDGFWLVCEPGAEPVGIQACGPAAGLATPEFYAERGHKEAIPSRGGLAALTVAGTIGGWALAEKLAQQWGGKLSRADLLHDAIRQAKEGVVVTRSQAQLTREKLDGLIRAPGFADVYLDDHKPPLEGARRRYPALAATLERLAHAGFDDFYRGDLARALSADLEASGSPLRLSDLEAYRARLVTPLSIRAGGATLYNMPPPTQGVSSLSILAILDRLGPRPDDPAGFIHDIVEATKQAFIVRDAHVFDPKYMTMPASALVAEDEIMRMAASVHRGNAAPWPHLANPGDTIWMGAIDGKGRAVSFIQSVYWEFGSGVVSPATGVTWQNRGTSFSLAHGHPNQLHPGRLPFHTLNPAMARFDDGRMMTYGTMGGEGQPQTQAAVFARHVWCGMELQEAVAAPRWLLGRTWGETSHNLKLEADTAPGIIDALRGMGHDIMLLPPLSDAMGHAGAILRRPDGVLEGAADPRSDGAVAAA